MSHKCIWCDGRRSGSHWIHRTIEQMAVGFGDFKVKADSEEAAEREAIRQFQCDSTEAELCEFLDEGSYSGDGETYVAAPKDIK